MSELSAENIKAVRVATGEGLFVARQALIESDGDVQKAVENLIHTGLVWRTQAQALKIRDLEKRLEQVEELIEALQ